MFSRFKKAQETVLDILFPPLCLNCRKYMQGKELLCSDCFSSIHINNSMFCPVCGLRIIEGKTICRHGPEKLKEYPYLLAPATNYDDEIIRNLIHYFKYKGFIDIALILGILAEKYITTVFRNSEIINYVLVPVPLHPKRQRQRGFNQSELLAKFLSVKFNLPMINALKRIKNSKPQAKMKKDNKKVYFFEDEPDSNARNYEKRKKNISGAFSIINPEEITGKNVILIDDVYTSGATMSEAARILKNHGAKKIIALVVAKA